METERILRIEPVGGLGEMGHHHLVVDIGPDSFLVDCGILFAPPSDPGVDRILPSFEPAKQRARDGRLRALLLTHGHLDHLGAVPDLLAELPGLSVYATAWAMSLLRRRLERDGPKDSAPLQAQVVVPGESIVVGETELTWVQVTHSLPEACSLSLRNESGHIVHSGDFRMQQDPLLGPPADIAGLRRLGDLGVDLALVDSTSSAKPGRTLPERQVAENLRAVVADVPGAVVITSFSSHVERMVGCLQVARATGRRLAIYGRSAEETARAAIARGLLQTTAGELLTFDEIEHQPKDKLLVLCTGTQAEWRAPLARMARGEDKRISLGPGDCVIWSARVIPGGEREVGGLINKLVEAGVTVVPPFGETGRGLHASGHGHSDEVSEWLDCVRPAYVLPVHGEPLHLVQHAHVLRRRFPADRLLSLRSGHTLSLDPAGGEVVVRPAPQEQTWITEGGVRFGPRDPGLAARRKIGRLGAATVVVPWSEGRIAGTPVVHAIGLAPKDATRALESTLGRKLHAKLERWEPERDREAAEERTRLTLRALVRKEVGTKPPCMARLLDLGIMVSYAKPDVDQPGPTDGAHRDHPKSGEEAPS